MRSIGLLYCKGGERIRNKNTPFFIVYIVIEDIIKVNTHIRSVIHSTLACVVHFTFPQY
jgi:hypothetical protein